MSSHLRRAASVILARPGRGGGLETFLLRRAAASAFVPNAFVFPGGAVDPDDAAEGILALVDGLSIDRMEAQFRATISQALPANVERPSASERAALFVAALRELFEEAGILFSNGTHSALASARGALRDGSLTFAGVLQRASVRADATALTLFSHWVTPESELATRRYDAYFFLARAPDDQDAAADAQETHDGIWIAPAQALVRAGEDGLRLVYPTIKHLERLAEFDDIDRLFAYAHDKPIVTIMPLVESGTVFTLPPELENAW